jgi:glycosyltransferase involved in cell wall biosynthesis
MSATSVLIVTPRWTRDGGIATHVVASATALAEHGVTVKVAAARIEIDRPIPGIDLLHSPQLFNTALSPAQRLGEAASVRPSVIHTHQFDDPDVVAFMRQSAPVLISVHGYTACTSGVHYFRPGHECTRPHGPGCVPHLAIRSCVHARHLRTLPASYERVGRSLQALGRADLVVSYSSAIDRHLAANGLARRAVVPLFPTMSAHAGSGHPDRRRVLFAGRIVEPKGVGVLIRAIRNVDADLVVCGDGWRLDAMRKLADRLGVADRVRFTGWLPGEQLAREFAEASVVAIPSVWPEPFGLVGIEAFAAGRPVVASLTGGIGDWLEDGVNGLGVKPGDTRALARALAQLLADPERQRSMGAAGREAVAARFTPEHHVAALLDAYRAARSTWQLAPPALAAAG